MKGFTSAPACNDAALLGDHLSAPDNLQAADEAGACGHNSCVSVNCEMKQSGHS